MPNFCSLLRKPELYNGSKKATKKLFTVLKQNFRSAVVYTHAVIHFAPDIITLLILHCMDYGHQLRKLPSLHGQTSTPNPKFLGTAEAYLVCHIGPNFQISLINAFVGCP